MVPTDWFVFLDLLGTIMAFAGGILLTIPAYGDNLRRTIESGIDALRTLPVNDRERDQIEKAHAALQKHERPKRLSDRRLLQWGITLVTIGLLISIPVKVRDAYKAAWIPVEAALVGTA